MLHEKIEWPVEAQVAATETPVAAPRNRKPLMLAGAALVMIAGGAYAFSGNDKQWSDAEAPVSTPVVEAAKPSFATAPAAVDPSSIIRGVIQSQSEATIASRMTAGIISMPFKVGQPFGRGALLASFDCSTLRAQFAAANAATAAYKKTYDTNVELDMYQAVGKNEVGVSKANLGKASAEASAVSSQLKDCAVYAPFSGVVVEQIAHANEVAATGQPLMKIQDASNLEVQIIVPSNWMTWMKPGAKFSFKVDETGQTVSGSIARLGASVDPVSKTIRVVGHLSGAGATVLPGMSGSAQFEGQNQQGTGQSGKPAGA
jgi:membrane fusion protein, multidrug efflux system